MRATGRFVASVVTIFLHPLIMLTYGLLLLMASNPFAFGVSDIRAKLPLILICIAYTFLLPLISIIIMVLIGLIGSIKMEQREERIAPLIVCIVFYTWFFINIHRNPEVPEIFVLFSLGSVLALSLAFFVTVFSKISLHTVGLGGITGLILIMIWHFNYDHIELGNLRFHMRLVLITVLALGGLAASLRLWQGAHVPKDVYGGYLVGVAAQFIALRILF